MASAAKSRADYVTRITCAPVWVPARAADGSDDHLSAAELAEQGKMRPAGLEISVGYELESADPDAYDETPEGRGYDAWREPARSVYCARGFREVRAWAVQEGAGAGARAGPLLALWVTPNRFCVDGKTPEEAAAAAPDFSDAFYEAHRARRPVVLGVQLEHREHLVEQFVGCPLPASAARAAEARRCGDPADPPRQLARLGVFWTPAGADGPGVVRAVRAHYTVAGGGAEPGCRAARAGARARFEALAAFKPLRRAEKEAELGQFWADDGDGCDHLDYWPHDAADERCWQLAFEADPRHDALVAAAARGRRGAGAAAGEARAGWPPLALAAAGALLLALLVLAYRRRRRAASA